MYTDVLLFLFFFVCGIKTQTLLSIQDKKFMLLVWVRAVPFAAVRCGGVPHAPCTVGWCSHQIRIRLDRRRVLHRDPLCESWWCSPPQSTASSLTTPFSETGLRYCPVRHYDTVPYVENPYHIYGSKGRKQPGFVKAGTLVHLVKNEV